MAMAPLPVVALSPIASFPENYFLENLAIRADGSALVTTVLQKELWYVPAPDTGRQVTAVRLFTFEHPILGIVEAEPDIFIISVCDFYHSHKSKLARLDLRDWSPEEPVTPEIILTLDDRARGLNGSCMIGPGVLLLADCFAGLIWRVDLASGTEPASAQVWLAHDTMAWDPDSAVEPPPQPGINGIRYGTKTGYVYYTSTAQKVFMRIPVDKETLRPAGAPEFVASIDSCDDFCVDENAGFAYITRHRPNTLDRVPLPPGMEARYDTLSTTLLIG